MRPHAMHIVTGAGLLLALSSSLATFAQNAPTTSLVTITHVKPEMISDWVDLQKLEVNPAMKKGGVKSRNVYSTFVFGNTGEYVSVQPIQSFAQFDGTNPMVEALGQAPAARLRDKLRKCIFASNSFEATSVPELSNVVDGPPPTFMIQAHYRITPGKWEDFAAVMKSDVVPLYKKANKPLVVIRRGVGANPNDVVLSTGYMKMGDWDGHPFLWKAVGQEAANKINAKFAGTRTLMEVIVRRRVPELSF